MNEFDEQLKTALTQEDQEFLTETMNEVNYYKEVFNSLKGPDRVLNIMGWIATLVASGFLIYFLICAFHAETTREQILFAALAIMLNSAQIALKMWLNMRMNRRAIQKDIYRLKLALSTSS